MKNSSKSFGMVLQCRSCSIVNVKLPECLARFTCFLRHCSHPCGTTPQQNTGHLDKGLPANVDFFLPILMFSLVSVPEHVDDYQGFRTTVPPSPPPPLHYLLHYTECRIFPCTLPCRIIRYMGRDTHPLTSPSS